MDDPQPPAQNTAPRPLSHGMPAQKDFNNPDKRLRPLIPPVWVQMPDGSHNYEVTAEAFPELFHDFSIMQDYVIASKLDYSIKVNTDGSTYLMAEEPHYSLKITPDGLPPGASAGFSPNPPYDIILGFSEFQRSTYDTMRLRISHEFGHAWRALHPDATLNLVHETVPDKLKEELESDLIGVCIMHDKQPMLDWIEKGGHHEGQGHEYYPGKALLKSAVVDLKWIDCPPSMSPSPLLISSLKKEQREK